jgi:hypothetical protein
VLVDRRRVGDLRAELLEVRVHGGIGKGEVGHQAAVEERLPLHAGVESPHVKHRRIRMRVLDERQIVERERQAHGMKSRAPEHGGISLQALVHLTDQHAP